TILISADTYSEQLIVNKNLTIIGAGQEKTIIKESVDNPDSTALIVDSSTVTISNIQFFGSGTTEAGRRGVVSRYASTTIRNCAFVLFSNVSIAAVNGSLTVDSVTITCLNGGDKVIVDSTSTALGINCDLGILLMNAHFSISHLTGGAQIDHVIDVRPDVHDIPNFLGKDYAVDTTQFSSGTIENSTIFGSRLSYYGQGIRIIGKMSGHRAELVIRNNRFSGTVKDSSYANPNYLTTAGISFNGGYAYADIYGNVVQYFNSGISVYGVATASIHGNEISKNGRYGIVTSWTSPANQPDLGGGSFGSPGQNTIVSNGKYSVYNLNSAPLSARFNNWGTTVTASIDSLIYDNLDNTSEGLVDYSGFLTPKPSIPALLSPTDGASGLGAATTLSWSAINTATGYRLQVSPSATFAPLLVDDSSLTTNTRQVGQLVQGTTYYWRVCALNSGGSSGWSATNRFTTQRTLFNLTGTVRYGTSSGAVIRGVTVLLSSASSPTTNALTDAQGLFTLASIPNGSYSLVLSKTGGHPTTSVNAADALKAALFGVDSLSNPLSPLQKLAADVNNDGKVNAADALQIMLRFVGTITSFARGDWVFLAAQSIATIKDQDLVNDVIGLAVGDVNGDAAGPFPASDGGSSQTKSKTDH
ncbi:MAG TPA: carboxypeptidase regulatory-like domain-containing protein, partial [Bacteroidota bacterium]|nr:carboxypeptidase regulatory-like domain-containing protein [Bacteroidota bacterium]